MRQKATLVTQGPTTHPPIYLGPFEKVLEVGQRQYGLYLPASDAAIFATWHLSSCVGVVGFDSRERVGFLFHVDFRSDFEDALLELVEALPKGQMFSFDYLLIGGSDDFGIEQVFNTVAIKNVQFVRKVISQNSPIATGDLLKDSYWSRAVRLSRSVAVDFSNADPLACLMSYEAELNPRSAFHKRQNTLEEADRFELGSSRTMKRV